jgi:hypothetical protein
MITRLAINEYDVHPTRNRAAAVSQPPSRNRPPQANYSPHTGGDFHLIVGHIIFEHLAHRPPAQFRHPLGKRHSQFGWLTFDPLAACGFVRKEQVVGVETATGSDYTLIRVHAQPPAPGFGRNVHLGPGSLAKAGRGRDEGQSAVQPRVQPFDQARARDQPCPEPSRRIGPDGGDIEFGGQ